MFQVSTDAGSRPWTLSRDLDAGQGSALPCCAYIQSACLSVCSTWRDSTSKTRQLTCRKGLPLPPKTDTRLLSPPLRRQPHAHRRLVLLLPPPARLSCRLVSLSLSLSAHSSNYQLPTLPPPQQQPGAASIPLCTPPSTLPTDSHTFTTSSTLLLFTLLFERNTFGLDT
jgi:hypothetical protein